MLLYTQLSPPLGQKTNLDLNWIIIQLKPDTRWHLLPCVLCIQNNTTGALNITEKEAVSRQFSPLFFSSSSFQPNLDLFLRLKYFQILFRFRRNIVQKSLGYINNAESLTHYRILTILCNYSKQPRLCKLETQLSNLGSRKRLDG